MLQSDNARDIHMSSKKCEENGQSLKFGANIGLNS